MFLPDWQVWGQLTLSVWETIGAWQGAQIEGHFGTGSISFFTYQEWEFEAMKGKTHIYLKVEKKKKKKTTQKNCGIAAWHYGVQREPLKGTVTDSNLEGRQDRNRLQDGDFDQGARNWDEWLLDDRGDRVYCTLFCEVAFSLSLCSISVRQRKSCCCPFQKTENNWKWTEKYNIVLLFWFVGQLNGSIQFM